MTKDIHEAKAYTKMTADVYDAIYVKKDYSTEAAKLKRLIAEHKKTSGNELLDVACGTGLHLPFLVDDFKVTGVDLSENQLAAARKRLPALTFVLGDMRTFDLSRQFDVVTCLFSSIGYVYPYPEMEKAVKNMVKHLKPGGVLVVEPWLEPGTYDPSRPPHVQEGELPEKHLKVRRTAYNSAEGNISVMKMHHVVERDGETEEFTEEHRLAMYTPAEFKKAFTSAELSFDHDKEGLLGRGVYIGVRPQ